MNRIQFSRAWLLILLLPISSVQAQVDSTTSLNGYQYPPGLLNGNFGVSLGAFHYAFSSAQLEPGYTVASVRTPPLGVSVQLYSVPVTKHIAASVYYMRPVLFVEYNSINGDNKRYLITPNVGAFTLKTNLPVQKRSSVAIEAGFAVITRSGITINDKPVIRSVNYGTVIAGAEYVYTLSNKWKLKAGMLYSPAKKSVRQPATSFYAAGFSYHLTPLSKEKLIEKKKAGYYFPKNLLQVGISTNGFGYGVNEFFSGRRVNPIPLFWGGGARVEKGISINYQRTVFKGKKLFSLEWGMSAGYWQTEELNEQFFTIATYPVFKFHLLRTQKADGYFYYSVAGPAFQSKTNLDYEPLGKKFTFRDYMGIGTYTGKNKRLNLELNIGHFSNGNLFPANGGIMVPLGLYAGYCL